MRLGFHLVHNVSQLAPLIDNEGGSNDAHELPAHEFFQTPYAVFFGNPMVFVG